MASSPYQTITPSSWKPDEFARLHLKFKVFLEHLASDMLVNMIELGVHEDDIKAYRTKYNALLYSLDNYLGDTPAYVYDTRQRGRDAIRDQSANLYLFSPSTPINNNGAHTSIPTAIPIDHLATVDVRKCTIVRGNPPISDTNRDGFHRFISPPVAVTESLGRIYRDIQVEDSDEEEDTHPSTAIPSTLGATADLFSAAFPSLAMDNDAIASIRTRQHGITYMDRNGLLRQTSAGQIYGDAGGEPIHQLTFDVAYEGSKADNTIAYMAPQIESISKDRNYYITGTSLHRFAQYYEQRGKKSIIQSQRGILNPSMTLLDKDKCCISCKNKAVGTSYTPLYGLNHLVFICHQCIRISEAKVIIITSSLTPPS